MLTLALETSTRLGSIAIGDGGDLVSECALAVSATHSETVLDEVARLLLRAGIEASDIERIVVGSGPGSFTGVRIAGSLAKGWCYARDVSLYAYSSLRAVAASAGGERVCALFDARRGEVYAGAYAGYALDEAVLEPHACLLEVLLENLEPLTAWRFAGEGATRNRARIEAGGGIVLPSFLGVPRAAALLWLARELPSGRVENPGAWEPRYVRASGAERQAQRNG